MAVDKHEPTIATGTLTRGCFPSSTFCANLTILPYCAISDSSAAVRFVRWFDAMFVYWSSNGFGCELRGWVLMSWDLDGEVAGLGIKRDPFSSEVEAKSLKWQQKIGWPVKVALMV